MALTRRLFLRRAALATAIAPAATLLPRLAPAEEAAAERAPALSDEARASLELALARAANPPVVLTRVSPGDPMRAMDWNGMVFGVEQLQEGQVALARIVGTLVEHGLMPATRARELVLEGAL